MNHICILNFNKVGTKGDKADLIDAVSISNYNKDLKVNQTNSLS